MLDLSDITLVTIDGSGNPGETKRGTDRDTNNIFDVIDICTRRINFGSVIHITASDTVQNKSNINTVWHIDKLSYPEYNAFCISNLNQYVKTKFCLIVQTDGFICNPAGWTNDFYNYDYIGCPWIDESGNNPFSWIPEPKSKYQVGCGGFSLRSKHLLEIGSYIDKDIILKMAHNGVGEDVMICIIYRQFFENNDCKFPTPEFAKKFALGSTPYHALPPGALNTTFGFHAGTYIPEAEKIMASYE
mgnify:CR=1 FL=1|tara:strand:- start:5313 stop:6047 length:735 start_codon:yes stop_codon:yes gene_type:complete